MLPRWREAFPKAFAAKLTDKQLPSFDVGVIWIRLKQDMPVVQQLMDARSCFGDQIYVVLSDMPNDEEALTAFATYAKAYCNSHSTSQVLQQIASVVEQGGLWIGEALMHRLLTMDRRPVQPQSKPASRENWANVLTQRELEVARTLAAGSSNKEIASQLGITERTVKSHIGAIFEKLKVRDRLQLAMLIRDQQQA
jgi:DNA-binding NarL/FixJ family response regulator